MHVRELTIPPSRLWSAEFRAYQVRLAAASLASGEFPIPARTASRAEWDTFDAWWERRYNTELLRAAHARYAVQVTPARIAGVAAAIVTPTEGVASANARRILINLRGGGFVYNRGLSFGQLESIPVSSLGRMKVITLDYRQAPFHSYPAATEDVVAVYKELLKDYDPASIGIFGCSAGGTLVTQAISWIRSERLPRPAAAGIFSIAPMPFCNRPPWGNDWGESGMWFSGLGPKNDMSAIDHAFWDPVRWYMETADPLDPRAYPGSADAVLADFPPTLFVSATRDFAASSVVFTHARFLRLGVDASLYVMEGGGHGAHVMSLGTPEAHEAQAYIARWFVRHLAP